jgi:hypothetical protein
VAAGPPGAGLSVLFDWQYDDSAELKRHYVFHAQVEPIVRWPN